MNKLKTLIMLLLIMACLNGEADAAFRVRPYGTIGGTVIDLPGAMDWETVRSGGGGQLVYEALPGVSFGVDLAYIYSYYYEIAYGYNVTYLNLLAVGEYHYGIMMLQAGLGPYFGTGINDTTPFGIMLSGGVDIPINERLAVAMLVRFDIVFENWYKGDGTTFMPCFMGGLTLKI